MRRAGILALVAPIPPATFSFHGTAVVHRAGSPQARAVLDELGTLVPAERRAGASVIEITPAGAFRTYGIGVPLRAMTPTRSRLTSGSSMMCSSATDRSPGRAGLHMESG